jgi:hypothetical protein
LKTCRYCEESFILLPGKPGYADECPECLHEKTHPQPPPDLLARFLKQYPERRKAVKDSRKDLLKLGIDESEADRVVAHAMTNILSQSATHK